MFAPSCDVEPLVLQRGLTMGKPQVMIPSAMHTGGEGGGRLGAGRVVLLGFALAVRVYSPRLLTRNALRRR
jgi:hypothetical protein